MSTVGSKYGCRSALTVLHGSISVIAVYTRIHVPKLCYDVRMSPISRSVHEGNGIASSWFACTSIFCQFDNTWIHYVLQRKLLIPQAMVLMYALEIASGMRHMHSVHVAHRDLKPANILVDAQYNIKIADFGTAQDVRNKKQMRRHVTSSG
jgi:serine/threonine protein kinase